MHFTLSALTTFTLTCLLSLPLSAAIIPADVDISASVSFDDDPSNGSFEVAGSASQTATMGFTSGGILEQSNVDNLNVTGDNPLSGSLQETGDGISLDANISGLENDEVGGFFFDFSFELANFSSTTDYMLVFQIMYENNASANDTQASTFEGFADSKASLMRDDNFDELFFTDLTSDDIGDQIGGVDVDPLTQGAVLNESGTLDIPLMLPRGGALNLFGEMELAGGSFLASAFSASQSLSITLLSITSVNQPPNVANAPAVFLLFLPTLLILMRLKKAR